MNKTDPFVTGQLETFLGAAASKVRSVSAETRADLESEITEAEVVTVIKRLKCGKAGGGDGITAAGIIWIASIIPGVVTNVVLQILRGEASDCERLMTKLLVLIPKSEACKYENYKKLRPIALYNMIHKVAANVLQRRLIAAINKHELLHHTITSYKKEISTIDSLHMLLSLIQNAQHNNKKILICNIDLTSAFDNCSKAATIAVLHMMGFPKSFTNMIINSENGVRINLGTTKDGDNEGNFFKQSSGWPKGNSPELEMTNTFRITGFSAQKLSGRVKSVNI